MFRQDVTVVITDGMRVISTNCEQLENILVQYYPIADVLVGGEQLTPDTLLQLKNDSDTWYGMFTQYRDYYLYAFFPSRVVYASRRGWMLLFTAIYLFCGMGYLIWRQYSKKRRLLRMEKEYHLVSAISSIYLSNLLIHPQDDTWEPIVQSERMKAVTNGVLSAKAMLEKFNTECVAEAYREEFRAFTDLDTAQQRLEGKAFDGFTMENVEGKWYQLLLVPQRRFTHREKAERTHAFVPRCFEAKGARYGISGKPAPRSRGSYPCKRRQDGLPAPDESRYPHADQRHLRHGGNRQGMRGQRGKDEPVL